MCVNKRILRFCCMVCPILIGLWMTPLRIQAASQEEQMHENMPPHLIQTVTEEDVYQGMLALGMLECPTAGADNCEKSFENVQNCVVRINMGHAYGSGIVWELTQDKVIIATNRHVLDYWQDVDSYVVFPQGYYADAGILGVSDKYDVGFLEAETIQFTYRELMHLRYAARRSGVYGQLKQGDGMFCVGAGSEAGEVLFFQGKIEDTYRYIADFDACMLYGYGFARTGMSGGGIFDGYGHLIGMVTGGTIQNEVAGVPLPDLAEAYRDIVGYGATGRVEGCEEHGR